MMAARRTVAILVAGLCLAAGAASSSRLVTATTLPDAIGDAEYWALIEALSEPDGYFQSDNLVSNEHSYQYVVPALQARRAPNLVYLGVAPDQNFTYILALQPRVAFIVDIRRGNLLTHLMYKAIFELSEDRADFLSFLFSRPRPEGLAADAPIDALLKAFESVAGDELEFRNNLLTIQHHLTVTNGFDLSPADLRGLDAIYTQFFEHGPALTYSSSSWGGGGGSGPGFGRRGFGRGRFPTWAEMAQQTDQDGTPRGYLTSEEAFLAIKSFQQKNLLVPVVGDHTGPDALRAVGEWVRVRGGVVGAFYTSNVEQYLFRYGTWPKFAANLASLPLTPASVIIRSVSVRDGFPGVPQGPDGRATVLDPLLPLLRDAGAGRIARYRDVTGRSH